MKSKYLLTNIQCIHGSSTLPNILAPLTAVLEMRPRFVNLTRICGMVIESRYANITKVLFNDIVSANFFPLYLHNPYYHV